MILWFADESTAAPPAPPPTTGLLIEVYIDGVARYPLFGWEVTQALGAQSSARFDILSEDAAYRPAIDQEVYIYQNSVLVFGGVITDIRETGYGNEPIIPIRLSITAHDFERFAFRRQDVNEVIPAGTLKEAIEQTITYAPGLTLDPAQAAGPLLNALEYEDAGLDDVWNDLVTLSGYVRRIGFDKRVKFFPPASESAPFNIDASGNLTEGDITVETIPIRYANRIIARAGELRSMQEDTLEQSTKGYIQSKVISASDITDQVALDAFAEGELAKAKVTTRRVRYTTKVDGLRPGQTQTITFPRRSLSGTWLITEVRMLHNEKITWYTVTATEGTKPQDDFRSDYRNWSKKEKTGGTSTGGGGGRTIFPTLTLAANPDHAVRSNGGPADWVPATGVDYGLPGTGGVHVQIDTDESGTSLATVTARLKTLTPGVSVQAGIWDQSASLMLEGVSEPVATQEFTTVQWEVELPESGHLYELALLIDTADEPAVGTGTIKQHD